MKSPRWLTKMLVAGGITLSVFSVLIGYANAQSCVPPPGGMTSWWPGDGNARDIANDHHGTLQNGATFAPGKVGHAFSFDGVDDYVSVPDDESLRAIGQITIDFWAKFNSVPRTGNFADSMFLIEKAHLPGVPGDDYIIYWRADNERLEFSLGDACDGHYHLGAYVELPNLNAGDFHHYAITAVDGGAQGPVIRIFFDGEELVAEPNNAPGCMHCGWFEGPTGPLTIGSRSYPGAPPMPFNGQIDELEIFNRALSASEIRAIFLAGSAGKCKPTLEVSIDIHPGSFPNSINLKSKGKIPVALLGAETFDANRVDLTTVRFGKTGKEAAPVQSALEDVNADGNIDVILHFKTQDTGLQCGDSSAVLTGKTLSGLAVEGSDPIRTVGCK